ncbi:hypothetical protein AaE_011164 [Aphanomyces astaci]|uniref:Uncharacterized protein n=1 Tax=Aphanomyces astaci TaxID=112090 RepID=A0A6A4ZGJ4_APHAT|nr:hypothetical protein AaE_011164 [Aphanomyces astaci]
MPNTNRDDAQGPVDGGLKSLVKHNFHVAEATGQLNLAHMHLEQLPQSVQFLPRLVELDLSYNSLNRFPGQCVAEHFKHLRVLAVEHNDLYCLDDILALSTLSKLESLNVNNNPIPLLSNRIYFLEARARALLSLGLDPN